VENASETPPSLARHLIGNRHQDVLMKACSTPES